MASTKEKGSTKEWVNEHPSAPATVAMGSISPGDDWVDGAVPSSAPLAGVPESTENTTQTDENSGVSQRPVTEGNTPDPPTKPVTVQPSTSST